MTPRAPKDDREAVIDLAREEDFVLGRARVWPPLSEIGDGSSRIRLQPRVMQVLVALARAEGRVVSRDELIARCWGGVMVGDDSLNRCIQRLRRVEEEIPGAFQIETLPRIGYRLTPLEPPASAAPSTEADETLPPAAETRTPAKEAPARTSAVRRPTIRPAWLIAGGLCAGAAVVAGLAALLLLRPAPPPNLVVAITGFEAVGGAPAARAFTDNAAAEAGQALTQVGVRTAADTPEARRGATLLAQGRAQALGPDLHVISEIRDAQDRAILWSTQITRPAADPGQVQAQVAAKLADELQCASDTLGTVGAGDIEATRIALQACDLEGVNGRAGQLVILYRGLTQRLPKRARVWSRLAWAAAAATDGVNGAEEDALRRESRRAADTAIGLDPRQSGGAYAAIAKLDAYRHPFADIYRGLEQGMRADPNNPELLLQTSQFLLDMGNIGASLYFAQRITDLRPLSPNLELVHQLQAESELDAAKAELNRQLRLWPEDKSLQSWRFATALRYGPPAEAEAMFANAEPGSFIPLRHREMSLHLLKVRAGPTEAARAAFVQEELDAVKAGYHPMKAILDLTDVGATDAAFQVAALLPAVTSPPRPEQYVPLDPLWRSFALDMRRDPRFMGVALRLGLADFWRATGKWPDFCDAPRRPYDCRAVVAQLQAPGAPSK